MTTKMKNTAEAIKFLSKWAEASGTDFVVLTAILPDGGTDTASFQPDEKGLFDWLEKHQGKRNIYFTVNPCRKVLKSKATKRDIKALGWLHVDLDPDEGDRDTSRKEILTRLKNFTPKPTVIIDSGGGYQGFWRLDRPVPIPAKAKDDIVGRLEGYNRWLERELGGDHCHNVDRLMRVPFSVNLPNMKKRASGRKLAPALLVRASWKRTFTLDDFGTAEPTAAVGKVDLGDTVEAVDVSTLNIPEDLKELVLTGKREGSHYPSRSEALIGCLCSLVRLGHPDKVIAGLILNPAHEIAVSVLETKDPVAYAERQITKARAMVGPVFKRLKGGGIDKGDPDNVKLAVSELGVTVSHNVFADRYLIDGKVIKGDADFEDLRMAVYKKFKFYPLKEVFYEAVMHMGRGNAFHPVRDYLDAIKWDGTERIDRFFVDYFGAEDTQLNRAVSGLFLVAAVRRIYHPGCKYDEMVVIEGGQGTGKSTALADLCGEPDWFLDNLPVGATSQVILEQTGGKWIVEFSELSGIRKAEVETIKSSLSRVRDESRMAYGRVTTSRDRSFIFAGTTNDNRYLRDLTGNRRFWPIKTTTGAVDIKGIKRDRDQLWAEAVVRESEPGSSIRLPEELWAAASEAQSERVESDPWEEALAELSGWKDKAVRSGTLLKFLGVDVGKQTRAEKTKLGIILTPWGFTSKALRFKGVRIRHFVKGNPAHGEVTKYDYIGGVWKVSTGVDKVPF